MKSNERRERRSDDRLTAMRFQLEACSERASISALVVADQDGLLLAHTQRDGVEIDPERFAALLPFLAMNSQHAAVVALGEDFRRERVLVRRFELGSTALFLGVIGADSGDAFAEVLTAARGVQRILS